VFGLLRLRCGFLGSFFKRTLGGTLFVLRWCGSCRFGHICTVLVHSLITATEGLRAHLIAHARVFHNRRVEGLLTYSMLCCRSCAAAVGGVFGCLEGSAISHHARVTHQPHTPHFERHPGIQEPGCLRMKKWPYIRLTDLHNNCLARYLLIS
jgi:hypothetical protein